MRPVVHCSYSLSPPASGTAQVSISPRGHWSERGPPLRSTSGCDHMTSSRSPWPASRISSRIPASQRPSWCRAPPKLAGRMTGRTARRLIRPLLHPENTPLLGFHGPAVPFWERKPDHPSVALAEPQSGVVVTLHEASLWCHFLWGGRPQVIGCVDPRLAGSLERIRSTHARMKPGGVLVVALSPPVDGHCYKVVEAVVPRR